MVRFRRGASDCDGTRFHQNVNRACTVIGIAIVLVLLAPRTAHAYIGPGAGFALAGSFLAVFAAVASALLLLLTWPIRLLWRALFRRKPPARSRVKRVVILGLDGLDYGLTSKLLEEGKLPHLAALRDRGSFRALGSTLPPISPVAWSSFQTGVNPGKHNIFDFLTPDLHTYQPKLSSVEIRPPRRALRLGKLHIPLGKADVRLLRKSKPFWNVLSEYGIFNAILRVPITFPAEKLRGIQLSAMCVPDLRGTQGMFTHYTTRPRDEAERTGGEIHTVIREGNTVRAELVGPPHPLDPARGNLKLPFQVVLRDDDGGAALKIEGQKYELLPEQYTEWVRVRFRVMPGMSVTGVCKFLLLRTTPHLELYVTPINIDPESPVMPIGYPSVYPVYLAKRQGPYATLGLAEDTWALNEHILSDEHFLQQCVDFDREREAMFFDSLDKVREGVCVCVFDGTDRMQHMFWRYLDEDHPARPKEVPEPFRQVIEDLYRRMDDLVGRTVDKCRDDGTMLMVLSDHGFNTFRRGIDLNRWLEENGYLVVDDARRKEEHLAGVDWSKTRAFALGLTGIFINIKDKYAQGIVPSAEADALRQEIAQRLMTLVDPQSGAKAVKRAYVAQHAYRGPYKDQAPDVIVGYDRGYRVSWDAAIGKTTREIFHDNTKAWSGDHCVDPSVVPGVLFCDRPIETENPRLLDIGPTVLDLFGVEVPDYMDGKPLAVGEVHPGATNGRLPAAVEVA